MRIPYPLLWIVIITGGLFAHCTFVKEETQPDQPAGPGEYPGEWMYRQRAFPQDRINYEVYEAAVAQAGLTRRQTQRRHMDTWRAVGPVNIGGRLPDIALHPHDEDVFYVAAANGGVFKTTDGGETWEHVFVKDGRLSIGDIALAPSDPSIIYIGTGEANASATSAAFYGDGIYRSDDAGKTWTHIGLAESHHIGRIVVDPGDADRVFVAATGHLYGKNTTRGIFRSVNGGQDWEQVLFVSDSTSAIDIVINPVSPDTLYAAMWERIRYPHVRDYAGLSSGVYRSFDGGDTWTRLENGLPVHDRVGRIGLAIAPSQPNTIYAVYAEHPITNDFSGLYKSEDAGETWVRIDDGTLESVRVYAGFGWYFGNVRVHPQQANRVYVLGLQSWRSTNGGVGWTQHTFGDIHVDHHALEIHPLNPNFHVLGTDGGLYLSRNNGSSWQHIGKLPVTEFYTCTMDPTMPHRYYGGSQDNGTLRTLTGSHDDWQRIFGGDGFVVLVDPEDSDVIYCEYQWGFLYKTTDGGANWKFSLNGVDGNDRTNWNTPYVISPHNRQKLYYGTHRLYMSENGADLWTAMSDDLTNTDPASPGGAEWGALSTIAVAPSDSNVIYTGSEDGYVFVTFDHGATWQHISDQLPERYITRVAVDPYDAYVAYVTISGYRSIDYMPHIFRTHDGGQTWTDISGNLPEVPINDVIVDPDLPATLYIASDIGVWYTDDLGLSWQPLGNELPMTSYNQLTFHRPTRQLLAASFGLSMWLYELGEPVTSVRKSTTPPLSFNVYPNPAMHFIRVDFEMPVSQHLRIDLCDARGTHVRTLGNAGYPSGRQQVSMTVSDVPTGLYILRVSGKEESASRIVQIVR